MRYLKIFILLIATVLAVSCDSDKSSSFKKGNPYSKEFYGIKGPVKYALYKHYKHGYVDQAIRMDFSTDGVLVKKKTFEKGDSVITDYIYDAYDNIQEIESTDLVAYKNAYEKGALVKEWFYDDADSTKGFTLRYRVKGETFIKKWNDIATGKGVTTTYAYTSKGILQQKNQMQNDGSYVVNIYDDEDHMTAIEHYSASNKLLYTEKILSDYDEHDNLVKYVAKKKGKVKIYYKVTYKYYTEDELAYAKMHVSSPFSADSIHESDTSAPAIPGTWLLIVIGVLSLLSLVFYLAVAAVKWNLFNDFGGYVQADGMRKMWMYNSEPYLKMGILFAILISSFLSAILLLLLFGGVVWVLFWIVKLILWAMIVIGWVLLIGGILCAIGKKYPGVIAAIIGGFIVYFQNKLEEWGEMFSSWGSDVIDNVNVIDWSISIFSTYGKTMLLVIAIPMVCFLLLALLLILVSFVLRIFEFACIKLYNVNRPCPFCGNKHDFTYMVNGNKAYPIPLHPGMYGIFHQTNHKTGMRMPTLMMNGKAKLTRRCPKCGSLINKKHDKTFGTDIHIGIVGTRSSGKSYLLYSGLELLTKKFGKDFQQVDADNSNNLEWVTQRIHYGEGIQTAVKNLYKAIQFRLSRKFRPVPYHLFFYDVAGEKFDVKSTSMKNALKFYTNVKTILFVIDPTMLDTSMVTPSDAFAKWVKQYGDPTERYDAESTLSKLKDILTQLAGRKPKDIDIIVVCTKKDLGYLENSNYPKDLDDEMTQKFICEELGLTNFIYSLSDFKSVGFAAVSATVKNKQALEELFLRVLRQRGIHID